MARFEKVTGLFVPTVTPFNKDESVNYGAIKECADFLVENGVGGLIPCGSTGEIVSLTQEEQVAINREYIKAVDKRAKVFASTAAYTTKRAVEMSIAAEADGADGLMLVTPWYMAPNENEVMRHYEAVRKATNIPIMIYHNPWYSTCLLSDKTLAKMYKNGFIDAIKERQADVFHQQNLRALTDDGFSILYGYDICPVECMSLWGDGWVNGTGNLFPKESAVLTEMVKENKIDEAMKWHMEKIRPYLMPLFVDPMPSGIPSPWLQIIKVGMKLRGVDAGYCRKPILDLPDDVMLLLKSILKEYGYLA